MTTPLLHLVSGFALLGSSLVAAPEPLVVFCAAGLKTPVEAAAARYRQETGTEIRLQFGGSGTLLGQLRVGGTGDLLIAADSGTAGDARRLGVAGEDLPILVQRAVIAVARGNPLKIAALPDLLKPGVRFAFANPEAASVGKITRTAAGGRWAEFVARVTVMKPTVPELAADLSLGALDAAVVWDSVVRQFPRIETAAVLATPAEQAHALVLDASKQATAALRFARWLAAPDKGGSILRENGFELPAGNDSWAERPELVIYSGGVNRLALEPLLRRFAEREEVELTTVFNGCGILCASMQAMLKSAHPKFPDAYYACDLCFMPPVAAQFPEAAILTETDIGIAVPKANSRQLATLADLARPGLRLGLCNAQQSTLGFMTNGLLRDTGVEAAVRRNVVVEVPTADFLINQLRVGALDAVIVYRVNAIPQSAHFTFIPIKHAGAKAVQPFAVWKDSPRRQLAGRLLDFLRKNQAAFEKAGFVWRGDTPPVQTSQIELPPWLKPQSGAKPAPPTDS